MDIDLAHDKSQGILRQRNGLALLSLVLGLVAVGSVVSAGHKDREVVLVPTHPAHADQRQGLARLSRDGDPRCGDGRPQPLAPEPDLLDGFHP
jgi:hypothetical protein